MRSAVLVAVLLLLSACTDRVWTNAIYDPERFRRDRYACTLETRGPAPPPLYAPSASADGWVNVQMQGQAMQNLAGQLFAVAAEERLFQECMAVRGYDLVTTSEAQRRRQLQGSPP